MTMVKSLVTMPHTIGATLLRKCNVIAVGSSLLRVVHQINSGLIFRFKFFNTLVACLTEQTGNFKRNVSI